MDCTRHTQPQSAWSVSRPVELQGHVNELFFSNDLLHCIVHVLYAAAIAVTLNLDEVLFGAFVP